MKMNRNVAVVERVEEVGRRLSPSELPDGPNECLTDSVGVEESSPQVRYSPTVEVSRRVRCKRDSVRCS